MDNVFKVHCLEYKESVIFKPYDNMDDEVQCDQMVQ